MNAILLSNCSRRDILIAQPADVSGHLPLCGGNTEMGMHSAFPAKMLGKVPTYYVDDVFQEDAGNGNIRVWNCTKKNGILVPQFEVIIASRALVVVGKKVADFAQDVFNADQLRSPGFKVH